MKAGAADNAPAFIAAFWDGCEEVRGQYPEVGLPDVDIVNGILFDHGVPYEIRPPELLARNPQTPIPVQAPEKSIGERSVELVHASLVQADRLLLEQRHARPCRISSGSLRPCRLRSRGSAPGPERSRANMSTTSSGTCAPSTPAARWPEALGWMTRMHGFLSSPSGGDVRHGTQLAADVSPTLKEAHLYCNLTRSYIGYLLAEIADLNSA
jgi:hypothetical protein